MFIAVCNWLYICVSIYVLRERERKYYRRKRSIWSVRPSNVMYIICKGKKKRLLITTSDLLKSSVKGGCLSSDDSTLFYFFVFN